MQIVEGSVVRSTAGHDKNRFYAVLSLRDGFVWIADGKMHRLEKPKRKNEKHLAGTNTVLELSQITSDKKLWNLLRSFNDPAGRTEREGA